MTGGPGWPEGGLPVGSLTPGALCPVVPGQVGDSGFCGGDNAPEVLRPGNGTVTG